MLFLFSMECSSKSSETPSNSLFVQRATPVASRDLPLPEQIHKQPLSNNYRGAKVGIFRFADPENQENVGYWAANRLYQMLLEHHVFSQVYPHLENERVDQAAQLKIARQKGYDLAIIGRVLRYLNPTLYQEARVDMELMVYRVDDGEILWWATASEVSYPQPQVDYFVYKKRGAMGLPVSTLINNNAAKITNLLISYPPRAGSLSEDMMLIDKGYDHMIVKDYDKAIAIFNEALAINPDNPYALLNLGVIFADQGKRNAAVTMYTRVIELYPTEIVRESNRPEALGSSLTDIARNNLQSLLAH
jgi:tetratricopeptide (TPR) repeat protein